MKKITFLLVMLFSLNSFAESFWLDKIEYSIKSLTTVEVISSSFPLTGDIAIPENVQYKNRIYSVTSIGFQAFKDRISRTTESTTIRIPNSVTTIGVEAFSGCDKLSNVYLPDSITSIGAGVFSGCKILFVNTIPKFLTSIGAEAFKGCRFTSLDLPDSLTSIGASAFESCFLYSIEIPNSVIYIGDKAFKDCDNLTRVGMPKSLTKIGNSVFEGCRYLSSTSIPNGVTSIGQNAFLYCESLSFAIIPNSVITIGSLAFGRCIMLTTITVPSSVTSIGAGAFFNCGRLSSVFISDSVTTIGNSAFYNCGSLKSVTVNWATPLSINRNVFDGLDLSTRTLNVPEGTETAYKNALVWKEFGSTITLGTNIFSVNTPVKFYPNPTASQINFSQEINNLEIFDIAGKKVKTFQKPSASFDVSTLEKGVYIVKGKTVKEKTIIEKLIKE